MTNNIYCYEVYCNKYEIMLGWTNGLLVYRISIRYYTLRIDRILREYFREFIFLDKFKAKSKR